MYIQIIVVDKNCKMQRTLYGNHEHFSYDWNSMKLPGVNK